MIQTDQLQEKLKNLAPHIKVIQEYWAQSKLEDLLTSLKEQSLNPNLWQTEKGTQTLKDLQRLKVIQENYQTIIKNYTELPELLSLFSEDQNELAKLEREINQLSKQTLSFKIQLLLNEPYDQSSCFLSINSGAGGTESQDWADMVLRMYLRFCEQNKLNTSIIEYQSGEEAGIKSATLYIQGSTAGNVVEILEWT